MTDWTVDSLAQMIDHALLHPTLDDRQLVKGLAVAVDRNCVSVCVKPYFVGMTARLLDGTGIRTGSAIGFPHGGSSTLIKIEEAKCAVNEGADEIDMVVNIGKARSCEWGYIRDEIGGVNACVVTHGAILKVTFETDYMTDAMVGQLCRVCNEIRPAYVKTSTGFGFSEQESGAYDYAGATARHLTMIREHLAADIRIKASGKIRTLDDLLKMRALGASRIGTSSTERILDEAVQWLDQEE